MTQFFKGGRLLFLQSYLIFLLYTFAIYPLPGQATFQEVYEDVTDGDEIVPARKFYLNRIFLALELNPAQFCRKRILPCPRCALSDKYRTVPIKGQSSLKGICWPVRGFSYNLARPKSTINTVCRSTPRPIRKLAGLMSLWINLPLLWIVSIRQINSQAIIVTVFKENFLPQ